MRRKDKEITDYGTVLQIAEAAEVLRIGLADDPVPYIVPVSYGYEDADGQLIFYFHGAPAGRKIDLIRKNEGRVSFELETNLALHEDDIACGHTYNFLSLMGVGQITFIEEHAAKAAGLRSVLKHYGAADDLPMPDALVEKTAVLKLTVREWTCKKNQK